jgi:Mg2+/Co2+ transporter CorC
MSAIDLHGFNFQVLKTDTRRLYLLEVKRISKDINSTSEGVDS